MLYDASCIEFLPDTSSARYKKSYPLHVNRPLSKQTAFKGTPSRGPVSQLETWPDSKMASTSGGAAVTVEKK